MFNHTDELNFDAPEVEVLDTIEGKLDREHARWVRIYPGYKWCTPLFSNALSRKMEGAKEDTKD